MGDEPRIRTPQRAVQGRDVDLGPQMKLVLVSCWACGAPVILATDDQQRTVVRVDPAVDPRGGVMLAGRYARWAIPMAVNVSGEEKRKRRRNGWAIEYRNAHKCGDED